MAEPGLYTIQFMSDGHAVISYDGQRVDDPRFVAKAGTEAVFIFQLENMEPPARHGFADPPIDWTDQPAPDSKVERENETRFTITVCSHVQKEESYPFRIIGIAIFPSGGSRPLDPTIVEKPPDH